MRKLMVLVGVLLAAVSAAAFDRTFENPQDVSAVVPHDDALLFPDGFAATIRLACDFDRLGGKKGACCNLVTKGDRYTDGYSIMVRWDGRLMVHRKGGKPEYWAGDIGLKRGVLQTVRVCEAPDCVRVFVDGVERQAFTSRGPRQMDGNVAPLQIGSMKNYPFYGRLERVTLEPASAVKLPPLTAVPEKRQARAEIKWVRTICAEKDRYIGWPTVCRLQNGGLLAVFSGDRDSHICPWGKVQMVRSSDDGETWSKPVTIANGPLDDRDAGIVQLPSGEIVVTYFTSVAYRDPAILAKHPEYARHDSKILPEVQRAALGYFRIASRDNGRTWSKPEKMNVSHAPHGPALLRDGSLFMVGRTFRQREALGELGEGQQTVIRAERSTDGGRTWQILCGEIPDTNGENSRPHMFHEPHVTELPNGELLAMVRYHGVETNGLAQPGNGYMRQMRSSDGGTTWTPMANSGILGLPPHLLVLPDGKVVCVYGRRLADPGFGEFAVLSEDGGRTWDLAHEIVLAKSHCGDLGYPASALLPDGWIVTVYYQQPAPGERPALMATKWRVTR